MLLFGKQEWTLATAYCLATLALVLPSTATATLTRGIVPESELNRFFIITFLPWCMRPVFGFIASQFLLRLSLLVVAAAAAVAWTHAVQTSARIAVWQVYTLALVGATGLAATETALDGLALRSTQCPRKFQTLRLVSKSLGTTLGVQLAVQWLPEHQPRNSLLVVCVCAVLCLVATSVGRPLSSSQLPGEERRLLRPHARDHQLNFRATSRKFWPLFLFLFVLYSSPVLLTHSRPSEEVWLRVLDHLVSVLVPLLILLTDCSARAVSAVFGLLTLALSLSGNSAANLTAGVTRLGQVAIALIGVETVESNKRNFCGFWFSLITVFVSWGGLLSGLVGDLLVQERDADVPLVSSLWCALALCVLAFAQ